MNPWNERLKNIFDYLFQPVGSSTKNQEEKEML